MMCLSTVVALAALSAALPAQLVHTAGNVALAINRSSGAIETVQYVPVKPQGFTADGVNTDAFRLRISVPGREDTWILSHSLCSPHVSESQEGVQFRWAAPLTDNRGHSYRISVAVRYRFAAEGVHVQLSLDHRHPGAVISEVWYPTLADLSKASITESPPIAEGMGSRVELKGLIGERYSLYPGWQNMGFVTVRLGNEQHSLYLGSHDRRARARLFHFSDLPGDTRAIGFHLVYCPEVNPGRSWHGGDLVIAYWPGDWQATGRALYRPWFLKTFGIRRPNDDWVRQNSFYQMIMMMLPEGNINYRIKDVPQLARDGLKYGVRSLQLAGWQYGGHDNGYPYYEPDPRLGTWDDLRKALAECHRMGVKVYFFANIQPAMCDLRRFRSEWNRYQAVWRSGDPAWIAGWGMGTLGSRTGYTVPLMAFLDAGYKPFQQLQLGYWRKLAEVGADGIHFDKVFPAAFSYKPAPGSGPDESALQGTIDVLEATMRECNRIRPGFSISNECNWDRVLPYGTATWWAGNMSPARRIFPEVIETVGHYSPFDFIGLNNAVRSGHAVMISALQFNRSMDTPEFRRMARYIAEVKRIRDRRADRVWLGEPVSSDQAVIIDKPAPATVALNVYRNPHTSLRTVILTNNGNEPAPVSVRLSGVSRPMIIETPFQAASKATGRADVTIPAEGIVFISER